MALRTDSQKCAHLLRRFGLGASEAEMAYYMQDGTLEGAIERLINYDQVDEAFPLKPMDFANKKGQVPIQGLIAWWTSRLLVTRRPLQEKMVLFWHNHFATSAEKVKQPGMMYVQNELFRRNAIGNFKTLLNEASKDPAMVVWLDNRENVAGKPNENFAREVMELFTLGIGNYTEHDIQQSARAFTGYSIRRGEDVDGMRMTEFQFRPRLHDEGEKVFFGQQGNFTGDDILAILAAKPRTAEYIAWKMWRFFAYDKPAPELTKRLGAEFAASGMEIKALLRAIMHSPEFYSAQAERTLYKNPCDFVIATSRALGIGDLLIKEYQATQKMPNGQLGAIGGAMNRMGMRLFYPPDVAGWRGGADWISTGTMVERISWADILFASGRSAKGNLNIDASGLFMQDPTPEGLTHKLVTLLDAPLPGSKMHQVAEAARKEAGAGIDERNANLVAASAARLIFASPEYQFS